MDGTMRERNNVWQERSAIPKVSCVYELMWITLVIESIIST